MSERLYEGDRILVQATVIRATPGVGVLVEMFSKTDQYEAWVRWTDVTPVVADPGPEPQDGTWLVGDSDDDGNGSVFRRDDAEGHNDRERRRYDRHWWDYAASEWIDWPTALRRGANPDKRLVTDTGQETVRLAGPDRPCICRPHHRPDDPICQYRPASPGQEKL